MKIKLIELFVLMLCVFILCFLIYKISMPPQDFLVNQRQGHVDTKDSPKKIVESADQNRDELDAEEETNTHGSTNGMDHTNKENTFATISPEIEQEEFIIRSDERKRKRGMIPPHRPHWAHLKKIHEMIESRGYKREELYAYYHPLTLKPWFLVFGEGEETARNNMRQGRLGREPATLQERQNVVDNSKTMQLVHLFKNQDAEAIEKWMKNRLSKNEYDIPALYVKFYRNYSPFTIEELLNTAEEVIVALDHFKTSDIPKEAILYEILDMAMNLGSLSENYIEDLKKKESSNKIPSLPHWLLLELELAGDW